MRLIPSTLILVGSSYSSLSSSFLVYFAIGLSMGRPAPLKMRPYQPSML